MPELRRELGLRDATAVGIGAIIGAGLYAVTGVAAGIAGPAMLVGMGIAALAAACNALSSAQLAASYPQAGGTYEYGYQVLNPWWGFAAGWMFLVSKIAAGASVALALGGMVWPAQPVWAAVSAVSGLTVANLAGIRKAGALNLAIVAITVGTLLAFVAVGARHIDLQRYRPFAPFGWRAVVESAGLLFFAFTGYARLATLGEEVRDPRRTIPRAIGAALGLATLLYLAVSATALGLIGPSGLAESPAPIVEASKTVGIAPLVTFGAGTALLGVLLSQILGISRMMFAMGRRADLPPVLARVGNGGVPHLAVITTGFLIALVASLGPFLSVVSMAAFAILLYYGIANLAALRMPRSQRWLPDAVPALGLLLCLGLACFLDGRVAATGAGVLLAGLVGRGIVLRIRDTGSSKP